jgi:hypothetical protein
MQRKHFYTFSLACGAGLSAPSLSHRAASDISPFPPDPLYPKQTQDFQHFLVLGVLTTHESHSEGLLWEGETQLL